MRHVSASEHNPDVSLPWVSRYTREKKKNPNSWTGLTLVFFLPEAVTSLLDTNYESLDLSSF